MHEHILRCTGKMLVGHKITMRTIPFLLLASHTRVHITYVTFKLKLTRSFKDLTLHLFKGIKKICKQKCKKNEQCDEISTVVFMFVCDFFPSIFCVNKQECERQNCVLQRIRKKAASNVYSKNTQNIQSWVQRCLKIFKCAL